LPGNTPDQTGAPGIMGFANNRTGAILQTRRYREPSPGKVNKLKILILIIALTLVPAAAHANRLQPEGKTSDATAAYTAANGAQEGNEESVKDKPAAGTDDGNPESAAPAAEKQKSCCKPPSS
jgi:hypothetical protein